MIDPRDTKTVDLEKYLQTKDPDKDFIGDPPSEPPWWLEDPPEVEDESPEDLPEPPSTPEPPPLTDDDAPPEGPEEHYDDEPDPIIEPPHPADFQDIPHEPMDSFIDRYIRYQRERLQIGGPWGSGL